MGISKKSTQTQETAPWRPAQEPLQEILAQAGDMNSAGGFAVNPYSGERVANLSDMTMQGIEGLGAGTAVPEARAALLDNLNMGETYRDFDRIRDVTADNVKANLASVFAGGGANSSMGQDTYTRALTEALAGVEYGAYGDAKQRQMAAIGMAPSIAGMDRQTSMDRIAAGGILDNQSQAQIDADMAQYYETEGADMDALRRYASLVQGIGGMGGTASGVSTEPVGLNEIGQFLSGAGGFVGAL